MSCREERGGTYYWCTCDNQSTMMAMTAMMVMVMGDHNVDDDDDNDDDGQRFSAFIYWLFYSCFFSSVFIHNFKFPSSAHRSNS